jgi:DNA polymerase alpha-associated DNA helicase A
VNVVASTGSSIGDLNTKGRWTSFYQQYLQVFDRHNFDRFFDQQRLAKGIAKISFDVVVMDEASKATPPEIALVLVYAKKAVLIGDHRQLPPMLDQGDFRTTLIAIGEKKLASQFTREDAETSHFERLFTNPSLDASLVSRFNTQYRMHPHINNVIQQFYVEDGGLHCGISATDADDPNLNNPASRHHGFSFPGFIQPDQHLVWVDVDAVLTCLEKAQGFTEFQASQRKDEEKEVGIITFYGKQRSLLQEVADEFAQTVPTRVRTVDKFQGMERNVVIVSMVRSNKLAASRYQEPDFSLYADNGGYPKQPDLGFAEFPNRLNVALSRAKRLLIIVGNSSHFAQNDCYRRVYEQVCTTGHVVDFKSLLALID